MEFSNPIIIVPEWLSYRPILNEDILELKKLVFGEENFYFRNITIDTIKKYFYENSRDSFYKLIRMLGFYGVKFDGNLVSYSGPNEKYPDVLCIPVDKWKDRIETYLTDTDISSLFHSCGIHYLKQLHGVPVKNFIKLSGCAISKDVNFDHIPFSIVPIHEDFFNFEHSKKSNMLLSKTVDSMNLSFRSQNCLELANVFYIGDLIQKTDNELLSIPHFGKKCLNEIKEKLSYIKLKNGLQVEQIPDDETIYMESEEMSI